MFRHMRRKKQELSIEECEHILKKQQRGFLSVMGDEEYPYVIPINYYYTNNTVIFHSSSEGHKIDAIKKHDKVSFTVIDDGKKVENEWWNIFKSVVTFGKITIIEDTHEKRKLLTLLGNKYFPTEEYTLNEINKHIEHTQVLKLEIEHMSGKIVTEK